MSLPVHPLVYLLYLTLGLPLLLAAQGLVAAAFASLGAGLLEAWLASASMLLLALLLSPVNVVLASIPTGAYRLEVYYEYVVYWGVPVPVPRARLVEGRVLLAVNLGGAVVPTAAAAAALHAIAAGAPGQLPGALAATAVTAVAVYASSRAVPGVGIVSPAPVPPLAAGLSSALLTSGPATLPAAYAAGVLGALIGADLLRLAVDWDRLVSRNPPAMISIGGAGVFDGVYLSGPLAVALGALAS